MMRLLEGHSLTARALIEPESMGLTLTERDSSATPAFGPDAPALQVNDWMQDLEEPGAGIVWRVKAIDRQYDTGTVSCSLEHLIQSLGDRVLGEVKTKDISGGSTCTARQAVEYILAHQSDWALGNFAFDGVSNPYHFNGETLKAALEKVTGSLEDPVWEYDFTVYPFLLHIRQQDQTVSSEMRTGRNLTSFKYTIDKTRMFTRFYPIGKNNKKPSPEYVSKNEGVYGRVDKKETDQSKATAAELIAWANERLSRHAEPLVTVTISGLDLSESTGESLDKLTVCHLCRVPLPEYGTTILEKVTKLVWRDKIKDRESVAVTLANALADVQSIIKEEKARGGGAARTAAKLNEENELLIGSVESGLYTRITQTASELRQEAHDESRSLRSIISQTAESIRQTVEDDVNSLRSQIVQTAESIRQEVTNEAASLRSSITQTAESIRQEVADEANSLRSSITQTASTIRQEVADKASSLRSEINQQAGRIDLVVSGSGSSAAIRLSAIVEGVNQSQLNLSADRVVVSGGGGSQSVKLYFDGQITAAEGQINDLKTGTTKATLINSDSVVADNLNGGTVGAGSLSIGSGTSGGSGTLYYRGSQYYRQGVTLGGVGGSIAEGHFLGDSSTTVNLDHYHSITATESGGQITITLGAPSATEGSANFNIAATQYYQDGVAAAELQGQTEAGVQINTEDGQIERALNSEIKAVSITAAAAIVYNSGTHTYTATGKARAGGNNIELDSATATSGTEAYSAGVTQGRDDAGVQINVEDSQIERASNSATKAISISAAAAIVYNSGTHTYTATGKARAGGNHIELDSATATSGTEAYAAGVAAGEAEFSLATVTLQGAAVSITPVAPTSAIRINDTEATLYEAGSGTKYDRGDTVTAKPVVSSGGTYYYKAGTAVTYYEAGTAVTRYKGNGSSVTGRGDSVEVTPVGTKYWYKWHASTETPTGSWYTQHTSDPGGSFVIRYASGTKTTYYKGNGSSVTGRGDSVSITPIGTSHSVTPINASSATMLGDAGTYYKGNGGSFTPQGSAQAAYRKVASGGDIYYKAAASITRYQEGSTVSDTYYTKS